MPETVPPRLGTDRPSFQGEKAEHRGGWGSKQEGEARPLNTRLPENLNASELAVLHPEPVGLTQSLALTLNWASGGPVMVTILSLTSGPSAGAICGSRKEEHADTEPLC